MRSAFLASWAVCLVACGSPGGVADAMLDGREDSARPEAAVDGSADTVAPDAAPRDASAPDARLPDATADAPSPDAAAPDAPAPDAAAPDAAAPLGFPIADPPVGFAGYPASPPVTVTGASNRTVSQLAISNPSGDCLVVSGGSDVVLEHLAIGPCAGNAIVLNGGVQRVTIRDVYAHDAQGNGVDGYDAHGVTITNSFFARVATGVYLDRCDGIDFERNSVLDVQGPYPRGQMIQFNNVQGAGNVVRCNVVEDRPGESYAEDAINMYQSAGTADSPILVEGNRVLGGGPSTSGGGILLGDGGGHYMLARDNTVIDPGQYGMAVAGGDHMTITDNRIFARQQPFTNVGLFAWDQYNSSCAAITLTNNLVRWTNSAGADNPYWDGGNCGTIVQTGNDFAAALGPDDIQVVPAACR